MVGFTPQVSVASWVGSNSLQPIYNDRARPCTGGDPRCGMEAVHGRLPGEPAGRGDADDRADRGVRRAHGCAAVVRTADVRGAVDVQRTSSYNLGAHHLVRASDVRAPARLVCAACADDVRAPAVVVRTSDERAAQHAVPYVSCRQGPSRRTCEDAPVTRAPEPAWSGPGQPPPSRADPTVARAVRIVGGAWGRHAVAGGWWTPLRVLLGLASFTLVLAYLQKSPCANGNWVGNKQYTHACYSDIIPLWSAEGLDVGAVPYRDHAVEYPVLTGAFMWLTAGLTHAFHGVFGDTSDVQLFGILTCLLLAACGLLAVAGTVGAAGRRPYDAAIFALRPLLVFHAFSNWDLFAMAFTSCALWAWAQEPVRRRRRADRAGHGSQALPRAAAGPHRGLGAAHRAIPTRGLVLPRRRGRLARGQPARRGRLPRRLVRVLHVQRDPHDRRPHVLVDRPLPATSAGNAGAWTPSGVAVAVLAIVAEAAGRLRSACAPRSGRGWPSWRSSPSWCSC